MQPKSIRLITRWLADEIILSVAICAVDKLHARGDNERTRRLGSQLDIGAAKFLVDGISFRAGECPSSDENQSVEKASG